ncbi:MAG TPA: fructosamine kinase family protein [Steroidobacteraceae bacterium]|nr:fructosamine kinase family protein [Steroidobacteraceae bacterium]
MHDWPAIAANLAETLATSVSPQPSARVHGGCINESYRWESRSGPLFVKVGAAAVLGAFEAEAAGLNELTRAEAVRIPQVRAVGATGAAAYLVLEWLDFGTPGNRAEALLGEQLANQHRVSSPRFGWERDNTIGSTPQSNDWSSDWVQFFRERRLRAQLDLARHNGHGGRLQERGARLLELMGAYFSSYRPVPSLLHGDLWGGNWGADAAGVPVIFDPAVYYGDREADIAMTRLFGGFSNAFYTAYHASWPLDLAAGTRRTLYNLYHVLNHLNLFGGGYGEQAVSMIDHLLAELGH